MKKITAAFGLLVALAACSSDQLPPPSPVSHVLPPKIGLDVRTINLADRSGIQPSNSPYTTNHFSPTIAEAIRQWSSDRMQAGGQSGQAIIIIKDASLTAQPLAVKDGIDSWFTRQQGVKYMGRANVSIEVNGNAGFAVTDASASRILTLPEDPTAIEKQDAYFTMLNGLMKDLGENLESGIHAHLANFITTAPVFGASAVPAVTRAPSARDMNAPTAPSSFETSPSSVESVPSSPRSITAVPLSGSTER